MENPGVITLQHAAAFAQYLKFEKRYSAHTLRAYTDDLLQFAAYLKSQYGIEHSDSAIRTAFIRSWLAEIREEGITPKSINRKISSLRTYFRFCLRNNYVTQSPVAQVSAPRVNKRLPVFVAEPEMENLFANIEFPEGRTGRMERLMLMVFYHTGVRLSELIGIKRGDIDFRRQGVKILGKGSKERIIPLTTELSVALQQYMAEEPAAEGSSWLFTTEKGKKLYPGYVYRLVKKYLGKVTTLSKKSPHVLRHSFATHLSNNGAELNAVKELLGHASLAATQIYTHNTIEKLKQIHAKAHPRSG